MATFSTRGPPKALELQEFISLVIFEVHFQRGSFLMIIIFYFKSLLMEVERCLDNKSVDINLIDIVNLRLRLAKWLAHEQKKSQVRALLGSRGDGWAVIFAPLINHDIYPFTQILIVI